MVFLKKFAILKMVLRLQNHDFEERHLHSIGSTRMKSRDFLKTSMLAY